MLGKKANILGKIIGKNYDNIQETTSPDLGKCLENISAKHQT